MKQTRAELHSTHDGECLLGWSTPLLRKQLDDTDEINNSLLPEVLDRWLIFQRNTTDRTVVSGWQSSEDLLGWDNVGSRLLQRHIAKAARKLMSASLASRSVKVEGELAAEAWANVLSCGGYQLPHRHEGFVWSGVYYLDAGDTVAGDAENLRFSGNLRFMDPRPGVSMVVTPGRPFGGSISIKPQSGLLVAFPSWLSHMVLPYLGRKPRVSVAFNVTYSSYNVVKTGQAEPEDKHILNDARSDNR